MDGDADSWTAIADHNVIALITGHIHKHTGTSSTGWWSRWNPVGGVERVGALRDEIPDFTAGAARGNGSETANNGVYLELEIDHSDTIRALRRDWLGQAVGSDRAFQGDRRCQLDARLLSGELRQSVHARSETSPRLSRGTGLLGPTCQNA